MAIVYVTLANATRQIVVENKVNKCTCIIWNLGKVDPNEANTVNKRYKCIRFNTGKAKQNKTDQNGMERNRKKNEGIKCRCTGGQVDARL